MKHTLPTHTSVLQQHAATMRRAPLAFIPFLLLILSLLPLTTEAQTRRALVIGLGQQKDPSWPTIHGDRDVALVTSMLRRAGYANITTLVNHHATKAAIVRAFNRLADGCREGDWVYVHFSGHGQQMTDRYGDEADGLSESWIPYDAGMEYDERHDRGQRHLADDEIYDLLTKVKRRIGTKGRLLVVVDACHSGDSTREKEQRAWRGTRDVFVIPGTTVTRRPRRSRPWIEIAACRDYQRNQEISTSHGPYGMLTYALCALAGQHVDNRQLLERLCRFVDYHRQKGSLPQTPQMGGAVDDFPVEEMMK